MTDFLKLSGIPVPISVDTAKQGVDRGGNRERALDGTLREHRRFSKATWSFATKLLPVASALAFRGLIDGRGHSWDFETHLYSSKGLGPSTSSGATNNASGAKYGSAGLQLTATTGTITFVALPATAPDGYSVAFWRKVGAGAWNHYAVASSAAGTVYYLNGVVDTSPSFLTVTTSAGTVKLDAAGSTTYYDDLVVLPYPMVSDWPLAITNAGAAFGPLALLTASGFGIENGQRSVTVGGEVQNMPMQATSTGFVQSVEFDLMER